MAPEAPVRPEARSGQVRFITRPKSTKDHEGPQAKFINVRELTERMCPKMSNELESDSAMVTNLESFGVDGAGYSYDETETEPPSSTNPQ